MSTAPQRRAGPPVASCPTCRAYVAALHRAARAADRRRRAATPPPRAPSRFPGEPAGDAKRKALRPIDRRDGAR